MQCCHFLTTPSVAASGKLHFCFLLLILFHISVAGLPTASAPPGWTNEKDDAFLTVEHCCINQTEFA